MPKFAKVSWNVRDIKYVQPRWSVEKCLQFLKCHEEQLTDAMIKEGWRVIEEAAKGWEED